MSGNNNGRCESCGRHQGVLLIDFRDAGPVFLVCRPCSEEARDRGCLVLEVEE